MHPRAFLDSRRWYTFDAAPDRAAALAIARQYRRADAFGPGRAFRVRQSPDTGRWLAEHAAPMTAAERAHGATYNRRMVADANGQRRMGL